LDHLRIPFSAVALTLANLVPLVGVVCAGWSLLEVVALYWLENLIIGAINVLQMATAAPAPEYLSPRVDDGDWLSPTASSPPEGKVTLTAVGHHLSKLFFIPFLVVHYGMFCLVHGVFVFALLGGRGPFVPGPGPFGGLEQPVAVLLTGAMWFALIGLIASHLYSYFYHFLYRGEFRRTNVAMLMMALRSDRGLACGYSVRCFCDAVAGSTNVPAVALDCREDYLGWASASAATPRAKVNFQASGLWRRFSDGDPRTGAK
jgi:hypothetical protein